MPPLAFPTETSDNVSTVFVELLNNLNTVFVELLNNLNTASRPDFKGCDWQTTDQVEIERFLRDPLNGKPFCNRLMYGVLQGLSQLWTPENESRIPKDLPTLITSGTRDPVGGMTTTVRALIERYQQHGVKVSYIFYEGARHELLNDFCRDQIHADVLVWLEVRLSRDCQPAHRGAGRESSQH